MKGCQVCSRLHVVYMVTSDGRATPVAVMGDVITVTAAGGVGGLKLLFFGVLIVRRLSPRIDIAAEVAPMDVAVGGATTTSSVFSSAFVPAHCGICLVK